MRRRAAREEGGDWPSLTLTPRLVEGTIVIIDLDRFGDYVRERGLSEYNPNDVTGLLSSLVEDLARKWGGVIIYGLNWARGTEEAVIEFPGVNAEELRGDLERIAREICGQEASATIVALTAHTGPARPQERREAYQSSTPRRTAARILRKLKAKGGGYLYINGHTKKMCLSDRLR